jgi:glycosyltransferase involved in cell wall biosynthesis
MRDGDDKHKKSVFWSVGRGLRGITRDPTRAACCVVTVLLVVVILMYGFGKTALTEAPPPAAALRAKATHPMDTLSIETVQREIETARKLEMGAAQSPVERSNLDRAWDGADIDGARVLVVTPAIAPMDRASEDVGGSALALCVHLRASGAMVSVLHTGGVGKRPPGVTQGWKQRYVERFGVALHVLPTEPVVRGLGEAASTSWRVMQWLRMKEDPGSVNPVQGVGMMPRANLTEGAFDLIIICGSGTDAYFPLAARHSGIALSSSPVVLMVDGPSVWTRSRGREAVRRVDLETDFLERKAYQMADRVIAHSAWMLQYLFARGFQIPHEEDIVYPLPIPVPGTAAALAGIGPSVHVETSGPPDQPAQPVPDETRVPQPPLTWDGLAAENAEKKNLAEWAIDRVVFVGSLDAGDGLVTSLDALDALTADGGGLLPLRATRNLPEVWFCGHAGEIGGEPSHTVIHRRALGWKREISLNTRVLSDLDELQLMTLLRSSERTLAVYTGVGSNAPRVVLESVMWGVPLLVSDSGGALEMIDQRDHPHCGFVGSDGLSLAHKLADVLNGHIHTCRPAQKASPLVSLRALLGSLRVTWKSGAEAVKGARETLVQLEGSDVSMWPVTSPDAVPLVSVIVVTLGRVSAVERAVTALEAQTFRGFEVIIVDASGAAKSSLRTWFDEYRSTKQFPVFLETSDRKMGFGSAVALGEAQARGQLLSICRDGEQALPHELEFLVRAWRMTSSDVIVSFEASPPSEQEDQLASAAVARAEAEASLLTNQKLTFARNIAERARDLVDQFSASNTPMTALGQAPARGYLGPALSLGLYRSVMGPRRLFMTAKAWDSHQGFHTVSDAGHEEHQFMIKAALQGARVRVIPEGLFVCHGDGSFDHPESGKLSAWGGLALSGGLLGAKPGEDRLREMTALQVTGAPILQAMPHADLQILALFAQHELARVDSD